VRQTTGVRPDLVAVDHPDFTVRRVRILVVEIQRPRNAGESGRKHGENKQELEEPASHLTLL
jgi:hypothetical protein